MGMENKMDGFKTWFNGEYPLPKGYERGPIGRDLMDGCEKAYGAGKARLQADLAAANEEIKIQKANRQIAESGRKQFQATAFEYQSGQTHKICKLEADLAVAKEELTKETTDREIEKTIDDEAILGLRAENTRLKGALEKYGKHKKTCEDIRQKDLADTISPICVCGLFQALKEPE